jgi:hypothetical protein
MANWFDQITDKYVSGVANKYVQEVGLDMFKIFPEVGSAQLTGYIAKYTKNDWLYIGTVSDYLRQGSTESIGDDYTVSQQAYSLLEYAFHKDISKDDRNEYDNPFDPVRDATEFVLNRINRVTLKHLIDTYFTASIWSDDLQGADSGGDFLEFNDSAATPVATILKGKETVAKTTGYSPNRLIMTADVFRTLKTHPDITGKMKNTSDKVVSKDLLAKLFEVDSLEVVNDVNSGGTDFMLTKKMLLCYTPDRPSKFKPSAGYTLVYKRLGNRVQTKRIPMEWRNDALRIEAMLKIDPVQLSSDLGLYYYDVIA